MSHIQPDISLVIPAFNEAAYLPRLLDTVQTARLNYRHGADRIEVIVADNASTDDTAHVAEAHGCRVVHVEKRAIAASRNGGAWAAQGKIVAFADADFRIHPETFNYIDSVMTRPELIGGATGLVMERWSLGIAVTWYAVMPLLWLLNLDGGVWFCARADFVALGGYNERRMFGEDVDFLTRLKRLGARRRPKQRMAGHWTAKRLGLPPALVLNSTRKFDKHGDWHMVTDVLRSGVFLLFSRARLREYAWRYWYSDRE